MSGIFEGHPTGPTRGDVFKTSLTRDDILDNITLYWLTNTAISSARLYWENKLPFFDVKNVSIPVAVSAFPYDIYTPPRSWAERAYPKLIYYKGSRQRRSFCSLGTTTTLFRRCSRRLQTTAQIVEQGMP